MYLSKRKTAVNPPNAVKQPGRQTIQIADDDPQLVQALALLCRRLDLEVFRSPDAMHALLGAHRIKPDLLLLDINMPSGNGFSVCEFLAGDEKLSATPVIMMSGQSDEETRRRCQRLGVPLVKKGAHLWEQLEPLICQLLNREPPPAPVSEAPAVAQPSAPRKPKVLCIDDDADVSKIIKLRLAEYGVDVHRAFNGMQGYWTALDILPDVVITDMVMPDGEGNYIFSRIKSHPLTKNTPVIILTGQRNHAIQREMFSLGIDAYLTKPIVFDELLQRLRQHVTLTDPPGRGLKKVTTTKQDPDTRDGE